MPAIRVPAALIPGTVAVLAGAVGTLALARGTSALLVSVSAASVSVFWAIGRWLVLKRALSAEKAVAADSAAGWGLLPWAAGWTPELRLAAWLVSGALTWYLLQRRDVGRRDALAAVGAAWGAHAVFVIAWTLIQNLAVIVLATRG